MSQQTVYSGAGWLPYGADDDSVILKVAMTTEAEMLAIAATATEELTATPEFDSELGMKMSGTCVGWRITGLTGREPLQNAGQISLEVESSLLTSPQASFHSTGSETDQANEPTVMGLYSVGGGTEYSAICCVQKAVTGTASWKYVSSNLDGTRLPTSPHIYDASINDAPTNSAFYLHSYGRGRFSKINVGWNNGTAWMAIDNQLKSIQSYVWPADQWNRIYLGNFIGSAGYKLGDWFIRNLQISSRPPSFPVHPLMRRVVFFSDSLFEQANSYVSTSDGIVDQITYGIFRARMAERGFYAGYLDADVNGGYTVYTGASKASAVISNVTDELPDLVVMQFGTNDTTSGATFNATTFLDQATNGYKALIDTLKAAGVQKIVVCTVPPRNQEIAYDAAYVAAVDRANAAIKTLPDYDSDVVIADVFAALGGEDTESNNYQSDGLHLGPIGQHKHGDCVADAVINNLLT